MANWAEQAQNGTYKILQNGDLSIEGACIIWTNFEGKTNRFGSSKRSFTLVLPQRIGEELLGRGWNIKFHDPREEDDDPLVTTEIICNMDSQYPPAVYLCTEFNGKKNMITLNEDTISRLDKYAYENVDLVIHPYEHGRQVAGGSTVKGYLKTLYFTQAPSNDFGGKYDDYRPYDEDEELPFKM